MDWEWAATRRCRRMNKAIAVRGEETGLGATIKQIEKDTAEREWRRTYWTHCVRRPRTCPGAMIGMPVIWLWCPCHKSCIPGPRPNWTLASTTYSTAYGEFLMDTLLRQWTPDQSRLPVSVTFREDNKSSGFTVVVDAQKSSWRVTRTHLRYVNTCLGEHLQDLLVIRPDTFWDTQHVVDNCAKTHKKGEVSANCIPIIS